MAKTKTRDSLFVRVDARVDALPEWLKPVAYGPAFLLLLMGARGAFIVGPILIAVLLIGSNRPAHDLGIGAGLVALLLFASAVGGLVYSVIGRWIRHVPFVGPWIAGSLSVAPYMIALVPILRVSDGRDLIAPLEPAELFSLSLCTILFGAILGYMILRPGALD